MKTDIVKVVKRGLSLSKVKLIAYSPEILVGVGALATVGCGIFAAKRSYKFEEYLCDYRERKDSIEEAVRVSAETDGAYTDEDAKRDTINNVRDIASGFVKVYWPAVALGAVSIGSNIAGICIMKRRLTALGLAYTAAVGSFAAYRKKVIDKFGEAADRAIMYGEDTVELVDDVVDENGVKKPKAQEYVKTDFQGDLLRRFFPESMIFGGAGATYGEMFAKSIEHYANCELDLKGYLFLNEIQSELGQLEELPDDQVAQGQMLGWVRDKDRAWDDQFQVKVTKATRDGEKGVIVEYPQPINLLGFMRGCKIK